MSNSLAIGAVTAALKQLLQRGMTQALAGDPASDPDLAGVTVTTIPLDAARENPTTTGAGQLNLFMYQVRPDPTFRNMDMPGRVNPGEIANQPLALDLHYILTAYSTVNDDVVAHRILGRAMSILHNSSTLSRTDLQALAGADIDQQPERVRIRPSTLGMDEISKLWTGFSQPYRISVAYEVGVVLIQNLKSATSPLPVLSRGTPVMVGGKLVEPGPSVQPNLALTYPVLTSFTTPTAGPAMRLGDLLTLTGANLGGTELQLTFDHPLMTSSQHPPPTGTPTATQIQVTIPNDASAATAWPAGMYAVTVSVKTDQTRTTNVLSIPLAPTIKVTPATSSSTPAVLQVAVTPDVWPNQTVALIIGDQQMLPDTFPITAKTSTLQFTVANPPSGPFYVRLRVDGVDSLLLTNYANPLAGFDPSQVVNFT